MKSHLTEEEKQEIKQLIERPEVASILTAAQFCLCIEELKPHTLGRSTTKSIKNKLLRQSIRLSSRVSSNLEEIIQEIIKVLACQREEQIIDLQLIFTDQIFSHMTLFEVDSAPAYEYMLKLTKQNLSTVGYDNMTDDCIKKNIQPFLERLCYRDIHDNMLQSSSIAIPALVMLVFIPVVSSLVGRSCNVPLIFLGIAICLIVIFHGRSMVRHTLTYELSQRKKIRNSGSEYLNFDQVQIMDCQTYRVQDYTYAPDFNAHHFHELDSKQQTVADDDDDEKFLLSPKKRRAPPAPAAIPRSVAEALSWPRKGLLFADQKGIVTQSEVFPVSNPFFPKNVRYWSFFNGDALKHQHLSEKNEEWQAYDKLIRRGKLVPPKGCNGIKQLKPRVMTDLKIDKHHFGNRLFSFSVKRQDKDYRLLGTLGPTQWKDNIQHKLIDFAWHWPSGPGHK